MRELKGRRKNPEIKRKVLDEAERSRLVFETAYGNEAKDAVKRKQRRKRNLPCRNSFRRSVTRSSIRQPDRVKSKGCSDHFRTEVYGKSERCGQDGDGTEPGILPR